MLRNALVIFGVTVFTVAMLVAATLRVNGDGSTFTALKAQSINQNVVEYAEIAREAYVFAQPLLQTYATLYSDMSAGRKADRVPGFNEIKVLARVEGATDQTVTVKAWLDLRAQPILLHVPEGGPPRDKLSVSDLYGIKVLDIQPQKHAANYLMVASGWDGSIPDGIDQLVRVDTDVLQVFSTTRVASAAMFEYRKEWSLKLAVVPLSAYTLGDAPAPLPHLKLPEWNEKRAGTKHFIPYLNFMLSFLHPEGEEAARIESFARIGIVPGVAQTPTQFSGAISAGIAQAREQLEKTADEGVATIGQI